MYKNKLIKTNKLGTTAQKHTNTGLQRLGFFPQKMKNKVHVSLLPWWN